MIQVAIENLQAYLKVRGENKTAVLLSSEGCHHCEILRNHLESIESNFEDIEFTEVVHSTNQQSAEIHPLFLFAPPVLPSIIGFEDSIRILEGAGMPDNLLVVDNLLKRWESGDGVQYSAG